MQQSDRAGLLYVLAGFCTLSIGDAIVKSMAGEWPAPAMAAVRYIVGTFVLAVVLVRQEGWRAAALPKDKVQWVRGLAISCSANSLTTGPSSCSRRERTSSRYPTRTPGTLRRICRIAAVPSRRRSFS